MDYIKAILLGYSLGCINPAYFMGKLKGFDIRSKVSMNPGASNTLITLGWAAAVFVGVFDIGKAFCAVKFSALLCPSLPLAGVIGGAAAVYGHIFPFYLKFKGGKGFACYMGFILAMDWRAFIAAGLITIAVTWITDYIALATLIIVSSFPLYLYFAGSVPLSFIFAAVGSIPIILKHLVNVKRMIKGEEIGIRKAKKGKIM